MKKIHLKKRKKKKILNSFIIIVLLVFFILHFIFIYINKNVIPIIMNYATSEVKKFSTLIINKAISKQLLNDFKVEDMFIINKSQNGDINSIDFDPIIINKLLNMVVNTIQINLKKMEEGNLEQIDLYDNLSDYDRVKLSKGIICEIPSGVIFKNSLLSNLGPKIPVKFSLIGNIVSNINTEVKNYGINNALIQVSINIVLESKVILPLISETIKVDTNIPIAMKLIQGNVPNYLVGNSNSIPITIPSN